VRLALTLNQYFLYQYKECLWYWVCSTIYFTHKPRQSRNMRFLCSSQDQRTVAGEVFSRVAWSLDQRGGQKIGAGQHAADKERENAWTSCIRRAARCAETEI